VDSAEKKKKKSKNPKWLSSVGKNFTATTQVGAVIKGWKREKTWQPMGAGKLVKTMARQWGKPEN